jgi:hypothetical protein
MPNRTDVHSPVNLVTEDYEYVGAFDNSPPPGSYIGDGLRTFDFDGVSIQGTNWMNAEMRYLCGLVEASKTARYGDSWQCDHCGARIRYVGVLLHKPTGDHIAVGETCLDNRFGRATVDFQKLRKQAQLDREKQRLLTASNAFRAEHDEVDWLALDESENSFVQDVIRKLRQYGSISDKQLAAIQTALVRDAEREVRQAAEALVPKAEVPEGKGLVIVGELVSTKWVESQYGSALKGLVKVESEFGFYKVWGTVPSAISDANRGDIIKFTANVQRSEKDADFGFFSRPRLATIVKAAEG